MAKLSMYSACQKCRCTGWKTQEENRHRDIESNYCPKFTEECRNPGCKHSLGKSITTYYVYIKTYALKLLNYTTSKSNFILN